MDRCRQCGRDKGDNGWTICGSCQDKNVAYEREIESLRIKFRRAPGFHRFTDSGLMSNEHRDRSNRSKDDYAQDVVTPFDKRNCRTDYHGYNYNDE